MGYFGGVVTQQLPFTLPRLSVGPWGCDYSTSNDAPGAIERAIAALPASGGVIELQSGPIMINRPVVITKPNVHIRIFPSCELIVQHSSAIGLFQWNAAANGGLFGSGSLLRWYPANNQVLIKANGARRWFCRDVDVEVVSAGDAANPHTAFQWDGIVVPSLSDCVVFPNTGTVGFHGLNGNGGNMDRCHVRCITDGGIGGGFADNKEFTPRSAKGCFRVDQWEQWTGRGNRAWGLGRESTNDRLDYVLRAEKIELATEGGHWDLELHFEDCAAKQAVQIYGEQWITLRGDFGFNASPKSFNAATNKDCQVYLTRSAVTNEAVLGGKFYFNAHNCAHTGAPIVFCESAVRCSFTGGTFDFIDQGPTIVVLEDLSGRLTFSSMTLIAVPGAGATVPIQCVRLATQNPSFGPMVWSNCHASNYVTSWDPPIGMTAPCHWKGLAPDEALSITSTAIAIQSIATAGAGKPRIAAAGLFGGFRVGDTGYLSGTIANVLNKKLMRVFAVNANYLEFELLPPYLTDLVDQAAGSSLTWNCYPRTSTNTSGTTG